MKIWALCMALGEPPICYDCCLPVNVEDGTCNHPQGCEQHGMKLSDEQFKSMHAYWDKLRAAHNTGERQ